MNFLKFVTAVVVLSLSSAARSEEGGHDHERLTTLEGRVYHEIFVIGTDTMGLTFRHREGIAKIPFSSLSESYRMLYEAVEELPTADAVSHAAPALDAAVEEGGEELFLEPAVLIARNRLHLTLPPSYLRLGGGIAPCAQPLFWPSWWPDHGHIHWLTHPLYRELATRDFLHTTGLLPFPCAR